MDVGKFGHVANRNYGNCPNSLKVELADTLYIRIFGFLQFHSQN